MRLMLGNKDNPSLLVNVTQEHSPTEFDFWVVNGCWEGTYTNGHITVRGAPSGDFSILDKIEILTDNQDRLRCGPAKYQDVFDNFSNIDYVAPVYQQVYFADMDDDIPF